MVIAETLPVWTKAGIEGRQASGLVGFCKVGLRSYSAGTVSQLLRREERFQRWFSNHQVTIPITGPEFRGTGHKPTLFQVHQHRPHREPHSRAVEESHGICREPKRAWRCCCPRGQHQPKGDYAQGLKPNRICPSFGLGWDPPLFFPISSFWCGTVCLRSSFLFWKWITCLVSQIYSWKGILPQDELYLEAPPYLISDYI